MSTNTEKGESPVVVLVIVLILVIFAFWSMKKNPVLAPSSDTNKIISPIEDISNSSVNTVNPTTSISYAQALVKYKNARLQLNNICQASPDKMTFKNNTNIMIDNRASVTRAIKLGSVFSVKAYSFKIVNISSSTLPATWYVNCDKSQNVATILIQK